MLSSVKIILLISSVIIIFSIFFLPHKKALGHICVTHFHGKISDFPQKTCFSCVWCSKSLWKLKSATSAFSMESGIWFPIGVVQTSSFAEKVTPYINFVSSSLPQNGLQKIHRKRWRKKKGNLFHGILKLISLSLSLSISISNPSFSLSLSHEITSPSLTLT